MRLVTIGDSITKGTYTAEGQTAPLSVASSNFSDILKEKLGVEELINYGVNGVSISSNTNVNADMAIVKAVKNMRGGDIIIVAAGTNDYGTNVPLGTIEDKTEETFYGALYLLYSFLKKERADAKIFAVQPIRRLNSGKNKAGFSLEDYRNAIRDRAEKFGLYVIDGYDVPIYPEKEADRKKYMTDGLHPNEAGHVLYADVLFREIKKYIK